MAERRYESSVVDLTDANRCLKTIQIGNANCVVDLKLMSGGLRNSNFLLTLSNRCKLVLRVYEGENANISVAKEASIANLLICKSIYTAKYYGYEFDQSLDKWFALIEYIEGNTLANVIKRADESTLNRLFFQTGELLAKIHQCQFKYNGFFAGDLSIDQPIDDPIESFEHYVFSCLSNPLVNQRIGQERVKRLKSLIKDRCSELQRLTEHSRLSHMDFGPENILVDLHTEKVLAIIDWEFAASMSPLYDIGHMLRPHEQFSSYHQSFLRGYSTAGIHIDCHQQQLAKTLDLVNHLSRLAEAQMRPKLFAESLACIDDLIYRSGKTV